MVENKTTIKMTVFELNKLVLKMIREQIEIAKMDENFAKITQLNQYYIHVKEFLNGD